MHNKNNSYILLLNPEGKIRYACQHTQTRFQLTAEQLLKLTLIQLKHPDMPAGPLDDLEKTTAQGRPWMGVVQLQDPEGEFWVNAYVIPVTENDELLELHCILNEASPEMTERARSIYQLRKAGKMPARLRYPWPSLPWRSGLAALCAFTPLICMAVLYSSLPLFLAAMASSLCLLYVFQLVLFKQFNQLVRSARIIVEHPIKQLIYTNTHNDIGQLQLALEMQHAQMSALLRRLQNTAGHIRHRAGQTMTGMQQISTDIGHQQTILEQLSRSASNLSESAHEVNSQVQHNLKHSEIATQQVNLGQSTLNQSTQAIHQLAESIDESMKHFSLLQEKSGQINAIMTVIQAVAEQTNLLALNAAIEAARAGEMGRGFAVVADEVRNLAAQTQRSAQDIQSMINDLQSAIAVISQCLSTEQKISASSVEHIAQAGEVFDEILSFIRQLHENMTTLDNSSQQQDAIALQVNNGVKNLLELAVQATNSANQALEYNQSMALMSERQAMMLSGLAQA